MKVKGFNLIFREMISLFEVDVETKENELFSTLRLKPQYVQKGCWVGGIDKEKKKVYVFVYGSFLPFQKDDSPFIEN